MARVKEGLFPQEYFEDMLIHHYKEYLKAAESGHGFDASRNIGAANIFAEKLKKDFKLKEKDVEMLREVARGEYRNENARQ